MLSADQLSPRDLAILRSYAFRVRSQVTREAFAMLPFAYPGVHEETDTEVDSRAAFLSGLEPKLYDCCPNSCCCYIGQYANMTSCPHCGETRYNAYNRPRKTFTYIPLIPRLIALTRNRETATKMEYRKNYASSDPQHTVFGTQCEHVHQLTGNG